MIVAAIIGAFVARSRLRQAHVWSDGLVLALIPIGCAFAVPILLSMLPG